MPKLYDGHSTPFDLQNPALDYGSTTQVLTADSDTLTPSGGLLKVSAAAPRSLTATPTIDMLNAKAGQVLTILNVGASNVALNPGANNGTALKLAGGVARTLSTNGSIRLLFDGTYWIELVATLAPTT